MRPLRRPSITAATLFAAATVLAANEPTAEAQGFPGLPLPPTFPVACPAPTAARCANPTFMTTVYAPGSCYAEQRQICADAIKGRWTTAAGGSGIATPEFLPDTEAAPRPPIAANLLDGRFGAYATSAILLASSADPTFQVEPLPQQLLRQQPLPPFLKSFFDPNQQYHSNGTTIRSCREYTYKRFWDYTRYQDDVAACERSGACIFDATYTGDHAIARRTLRQRNGATPLDSQIELRVGTFPKNLFAGATAPELWDYTNAGFGPGIPSYVPADPIKAAKVATLKARLAALPRYVLGSGSGIMVGPPPVSVLTPPPLVNLPPNGDPSGDPPGGNGNPNGPPLERFFDEWAWHQAMHDRTTTVSPAQFLELAQRKAAFAERIRDLQLANVWAASSPGTTAATKAVHRARAAFTDALLTELDLGVDGCLDASSYACDWSYGEFADRFTRLYGPEMNAANADCTELVGPKAFSAAAVPVDASGPGVLPGQPLPRTDVGPFKAWLDARKAALKAQFLKVPTYPGTGLSDGVVGSQLTSSNRFGDPSTFGAGYSYDIGWNVRKIAQRGDGTACAFAGELRANAEADAFLFGRNVASITDSAHVIESKTRITMDPREYGGAPHFTSATSVLDYDLYTPRDEVAPTFSIVAPDQNLPTPLRVRATFVVVVVPVTIEAWPELKFGAEGTFGANATNTCATTVRPNFGLNAEMRPHADADAIATVAVGVPGFQFGVKGRVALIHVDVPIRGGINVAEVDAKTVLRFDTSGFMKLSELSGNMSVFAEALFLTYEKQIFAWDGFHQDLEMWNAESSIDLEAYRLTPVKP
ncbi:MAG: hypothetical protein JST00_25060 [Deltaproteobacteria bacterium]|nr:hypothetical protein [Deltaproteobacteria bacterium]